MQKKTLTKLILDITMTVLFIILIYPRETGFTFHEIAGLSIGALCLYHIMLNWSWVKNVTKNLFNSRMKRKTKFFYLLNSLSLVGLATIIITGVQISEVLFPAQGMISHTTVLVHKWTSYGCLVLFGLHLALHWRFFVQTVPRMLMSPGRPAWGRMALNFAAVILILGLLYSQIAVSSTGNTNQAIAGREPQDINDTFFENRPRPFQEPLSPDSSEPLEPGPGQSNQNNMDTSISKDTDNSSMNTSISNDNDPGSADNSSITTESNNDPEDNQLTLADYLSRLFCTGCEKHCSLLNPRCERGIPQQEAATQEYQAIYSSTIVQ